MRLSYSSILLFCVAIFPACKKFVQVNPPVTEIAGTEVYSNNTSASAVMTGLYSTMMGSGAYLSDGTSSIGFLCGLSADELKNYYSSSPTLSLYYANSVNNTNTVFWTEIYNEIYTTNATLEGLAKSSGVSVTIKKQLNGEAKFMRAFLHFYAVNLFGDVPLVISTDYQTNNLTRRVSKSQVYQQIITDLKDAVSDLKNDYVDASGNITSERVRPNKVAAEALLARVYLYTGDWQNAKVQADSVIKNATNYSILTDLSQVFLANSQEAIWQLAPVNPAYNTYDGFFFVLTSPPGTARFPVALTTDLVNSFEPDDARFSNWVQPYVDNADTFYYPFKYREGQRYQPVTEYLMVLRLAEQFLIRAEAEANGADGGISAAVSDLNVIRARANLPQYGGVMDKPSVLSAITHERQVELFTEWGHRWFDLKRMGIIDAVMSSVTPQKGGSWSPYKSLFPVPIYDLNADPNLTQTPGYN